MPSSNNKNGNRSSMTTAPLKPLLEYLAQIDSAHAHRHIEFNDFLTNHSTHGVVALHFLVDDLSNSQSQSGGSTGSDGGFDAVQQFADHYCSTKPVFTFEDDIGVHQRCDELSSAASPSSPPLAAFNAALLGRKRCFKPLLSRMLDDLESHQRRQHASGLSLIHI